MRITLDALLVLDAIDRKGSFAAAAEELNRVPSALTYTVQKLEQGLDVELFDRSGHRARLTPAGRELLDEGRHLLRAAGELELSVKRIATGWEAELRLAVSDLLPLERFYPLLDAFYREGHGTRLRLSTEVFGGAWDALVDDRADLVVGATGESPAGGGYATRVLGSVPFDFVVPPDHPLADAEEPLSDELVQRHRAIAAADSSRRLAPRTSALLGGQEVLTVPTIGDKHRAHLAGLGIGSLPRYMIADDVAAGRLVRRRLANPQQPAPQLLLAWNSRHKGHALRWFVERLREPGFYAGLLSDAPG
jgi:DNA-binding transcriptional LysR family regulator